VLADGTTAAVQTERKIGTSRFQGSYSNLTYFTARGDPHLGVRMTRGRRDRAQASPYRSGRSPDWLKMKNPEAPAVRREAEEDCGRD
jgi:hypothetical protein